MSGSTAKKKRSKGKTKATPAATEEQCRDWYHQLCLLRRFEEKPLGRSLLGDVFKVEVKKVQLAYLERGLGAPQKYLQPVFVFHCDAHAKGEKEPVVAPYTRYVEALERSPEAMWQEGREYPSGEAPVGGFKRGED